MWITVWTMWTVYKLDAISSGLYCSFSAYHRLTEGVFSMRERRVFPIVRFLFSLAVTVSCFVVFVGAIIRAEEAVASTAAAFTVCIDAGHGGMDGGAVGTDTGVVESTLNLKVAKLLKSKLEARGVKVIMTRTDENALGKTKGADMQRRGEILRDPSVDLVVSIHMNIFSDRGVSGAMAYYMAGSQEGERLAQSVIDSISAATAQKPRAANPGDYFVVRECAAPAVLVECGFLSNPADEQKLQDPAHQQTLAKAIADGVMAYMGVGA